MGGCVFCADVCDGCACWSATVMSLYAPLYRLESGENIDVPIACTRVFHNFYTWSMCRCKLDESTQFVCSGRYIIVDKYCADCSRDLLPQPHTTTPFIFARLLHTRILPILSDWTQSETHWTRGGGARHFLARVEHSSCLPECAVLVWCVCTVHAQMCAAAKPRQLDLFVACHTLSTHDTMIVDLCSDSGLWVCQNNV